MQKNILFTGNALPNEHRDSLERLGYRVLIEAPDLTEDALINALKGVAAYILGGTEKATRRVIESATDLKIISFFGVGYESYIDLPAATEKGVAVTNTPGANADSVAEFTIALMLDAVKKTSLLVETTKSGNWAEHKSWNLRGRTLGIIGLGTIGGRVAEIAHCGFGMKILYTARTRKEKWETQVDARLVDLQQLLRESDVVSLHCSSNEQTIGLLGTEEFQLMKSHSVLINCSRAELVDPRALYQALSRGVISSAAFDGYYIEPAAGIEGDQYGLFALSNDKFLVTPHSAYYTEDATRAMADMTTASILDLFAGRTVSYLLNPDYKLKASISGQN